MNNDENKFETVIALLKEMVDWQKKTYYIMSKYDSEYLTEVGKDGFARED